MKKNFVLWMVLFLAALSLEAGKLEEFEQEYKFLRSNWHVYNSKKRKINREQEISRFRKRVGLASDSAIEIQLAAEKSGIKGITMGDDFREAVSYLRVMGGKMTKENAGLHSQALARVDQQLALLKQLKFSVEEGTFSKQEYSGTGGMDALKQLEDKMNRLNRSAGKNTFVSVAYIENLKKRDFAEFRNLASEISAAAGEQKRNLPESCQLEEHADSFLRDLEELYRLRSEEKRTRNGKRFERTIDPGKLKSLTGKLKFDAELIRQDIAALRRSGFSMEKIKPAPYDAARNSNETIQRTEGAFSAKEQAPADPVAKLDALKNKVYHSESRMNGVSQKLYDRYRRLLTSRQADEMDREYRKASDQGYPPGLARGNAVRKIHGKYLGRKDVCTKDELNTILRKAASQGEQP